MFYAYMKRKEVGESIGAEDFIRIGEATQEKLDETIAHNLENGFEMSTVEEYVSAGNAQPDDTDESPLEGDAAGITNADIPAEEVGATPEELEAHIEATTDTVETVEASQEVVVEDTLNQ